MVSIHLQDEDHALLEGSGINSYSLDVVKVGLPEDTGHLFVG